MKVDAELIMFLLPTLVDDSYLSEKKQLTTNNFQYPTAYGSYIYV